MNKTHIKGQKHEDLLVIWQRIAAIFVLFAGSELVIVVVIVEVQSS